MDKTVSELVDFVEGNDVKFIRLVFCDLFGRIKNISVMAEHLLTHLQNGVSFDASAIQGFMHVEESDLLLQPDFGTLSLLPWRPHSGSVMRVFCDVCHPDGTPFEGDCRGLLKRVVKRAQQMGYACKVGNECEFYLFETDDLGRPTLIPQDNAGYLDFAPDDKGENIRRDICLSLEQMGIQPETSHHKQGPGQNEIAFRFGEAVDAADNFTMFKAAVKTVAGQNGLYASFMPKPLADKSGNGLHLNMSLFQNGANLFQVQNGKHSAEAESFIEGVLTHIRDITVFLNPYTNSYKRLGHNEAPVYVTWSHQNRSQLIRIPPATGENARMELRSPDPNCNPYLALALLISAGLDGVERGLKLRAPHNLDCHSADAEQLTGVQKLPETLEEAVQLAEESDFLKQILPPKIISTYLGAKKSDAAAYRAAIDKADFERNLYF